MHDKRLSNLRKQIKEASPFKGIDTFLGSKIGGHSQTLLGHFLPTRELSLGNAERIELEVSNGDRLVGFKYLSSTKPEVGLLHIFHGLAGSSESFYMPRAAHGALELGFTVVLWNHRGCGPGRKLAIEPYHSGRSDDLARAVRWGRELKRSTTEAYTHGVLGYSLSANATCLLAAQVVPALDTQPLSDKAFKNMGSLPDFAIAVNPPFNLKRAAERLSQGPSRIYGQSFMPALLESLDDRTNREPENSERRVLINLASRARKKLSVFDSVGTFDAAYTGPAGGFQDHLDYYDRASSGRYFHLAKIPLVILSADDDPITNGFRDLPQEKFPSSGNGLIVIDDQAEGGHMGYIDRRTLFSPWKKKSRWLERRIKLYLQAFCETRESM